MENLCSSNVLKLYKSSKISIKYITLWFLENNNHLINKTTEVIFKR